MSKNLQSDPLGDDRAAISERMIAVRNRGLLNARDLSEEVERLGDWREHVRAYPVPLALAAVSLGYWMIPTRTKARKVHAADHQPVAASAQSSTSTTGAKATNGDAKNVSAGGLSSAALGFVGSLAANAIRSYISEQLHTLIQGDSQHEQQQRKAPPRFSQR